MKTESPAALSGMVTTNTLVSLLFHEINLMKLDAKTYSAA
jgi:hypothetical protein